MTIDENGQPTIDLTVQDTIGSYDALDTVDAVVVGAGPAGLNAALILVRACRRVVLCDDGAPRNAASHAMHNFLSRDGMDPAELRRLGGEELQRYGAARFVQCTVEDVTRIDDAFRV